MSALVETRAALHAVAEQVLAAARHQATGRIGLRVTPGGFGTPPFPVDGIEHQVRIDGVDLVVVEGDSVRRMPLRTVGEAAAFVGIEPGAPPGVYPPATSVDPDAVLPIDPAAAATIHDWFRLSGSALDRLCATDPPPGPIPLPQLWPEHFDLAVTIAEVNYGGSPGDADHPAPYAYVGPWRRDGLAGDFWNEPFGASRPGDELRSEDDLLAFFEQGRRLTGG